MTTIQINFTVSVDVDRRSSRFAELAVEALDPNKRGPRMSNRPAESVDDAEKRISHQLALEAAKDILGRPVNKERYGGLTITVTSPRTLVEAMDQEKST